MKIAPDVARTAKYFGLDPRLIQAVVTTEVDILKAVRRTRPKTKDRQEALDFLCRSAVQAMSDFLKVTETETFVAFWSVRWDPAGADNDPLHLNAAWPRSVLKLWLKP